MVMLLFINSIPIIGTATVDETAVENETNAPSFSEIDEFFQEYHTYETTVEHLRMVEGKFPDIVKVYDLTENTDLGHTYEGRSVWAAKVSKGVKDEPSYYDDPDKPNILIIGAHHAREWMSYEVCLYTLFYLTYNYGAKNLDDDEDGLYNEDILDGADNDDDGVIDEDPSQGRVNFLVENREIWIVPILNPDGVAYDHTISTAGENGGWRKNLRDNNGNDNFDEELDGVDLNRNYPFRWAENLHGRVIDRNGAFITQDSSLWTSSNYHGPEDNNDDDGDGIYPKEIVGKPGKLEFIPDLNNVDEDPVDGRDNDNDGKYDEDRDGGFSEPETQAIGALVKTYDDQPDTGNMPFSTSMSYHSYSGLVLWPWGYSRRETPHDSLFLDVGNELASITGYEGRQAVDLYPTSGDSEDWLYATGNILAFTIELEGPDGGFHPTTEHIIPISRKALAANLYLGDVADKIDVAKQYYLTLEQSLLGLEVVNLQTVVQAGEEIAVEVEVTNENKMVPGSLTLHYSEDGIKFEDAFMMPDPETGYYGASIRGIPPDTTLRYYVTARDVSGIVIRAPDYGGYDPLTMDVIDEPGLSTLEDLIMKMMMFIILLVIWGGFVGFIVMAQKAEKRKSAIAD